VTVRHLCVCLLCPDSPQQRSAMFTPNNNGCFCHKCGTRNGRGGRFCTFCGAERRTFHTLHILDQYAGQLCVVVRVGAVEPDQDADSFASCANQSTVFRSHPCSRSVRPPSSRRRNRPHASVRPVTVAPVSFRPLVRAPLEEAARVRCSWPVHRTKLRSWRQSARCSHRCASRFRRSRPHTNLRSSIRKH
jgi:hypothetical protein